MMPRQLFALFLLSVLETALPLFGADGTREPSPLITTERVDFAPAGTIQIRGTYGSLTVDGWDQSQVEVIVTKSLQFDYKAKRPDDVAKRLGGILTSLERKSSTELLISTALPARRSRVPLVMSRTTNEGVLMEYEIHVPRDSRLAIHHGTGYVTVSDVTGDIEASVGRGDLMLWLLPGAYSVDAKTKFGLVSSELDGARLSQYVIGQRFTRSGSPAEHRLHLRMGFGGITVMETKPESAVPTAAAAAK